MNAILSSSGSWTPYAQGWIPISDVHDTKNASVFDRIAVIDDGKWDQDVRNWIDAFRVIGTHVTEISKHAFEKHGKEVLDGR